MPLWLLSPKVWGAGLVALLILIVCVQSVRLKHAKRDQIDAATGIRWKDEYVADHLELGVQKKLVAVCNTSFQNLSANVAQQSAAVVALQEAGQRASAAATQAAAASVRAAASAVSQGKRVDAVKETSCAALDDLRKAAQ